MEEVCQPGDPSLLGILVASCFAHFVMISFVIFFLFPIAIWLKFRKVVWFGLKYPVHKILML